MLPLAVDGRWHRNGASSRWRTHSSLPQRYRGADEGFSARYRIELEDLGTGWGVELGPDSCVVVPGNCKDADVVIGTDSQTWLQLRGQALRPGRLPLPQLWPAAMDLAIAFEGFFRLPPAAACCGCTRSKAGRRGYRRSPPATAWSTSS
jgi:hypothetical protein